nr:putative ribonuclease H-like domain-containing protein [Tanacetum cinerariifolium]
MAMLTVRARRFLQRTGRNLGANGPTSMGFDMSKVECYNCHRKGHFAMKCRSPKDTRRNGAAEPQMRNVLVETSASNALVSQCDGVGSYDWSFQAEEKPTNYALMAFSSSSSSSDNKVVSCSKACTKAYAQLHDESLPPSPIYDRYQSGYGYHAVPPPYTGTFMPPKPDLVFNNAPTDVEIDHLAFTVKISPNKPDQVLSHTHRSSTPIIEDWVSDSEDESKTTTSQNVPSFVQPTKQVKSHRPSVQHVETSIPPATPKTAILKPTSNGKCKNRKACFRPVTTDVHKTSVTRPRQAKTVVTKPNSPPRRLINCSLSPKASTFPSKVTATKGNPQHALKDKGVIDNGCSRHMTGNMSCLFDFEELNGGYIAFGGNPKGGKISDSLGKFDGKVDEGFLVGYFVSSKAFRVFNCRTRIIQETLHVNFLENKPNVAGSGPTWLFDIDTLTRTMNYQPLTAGNQSNLSAGNTNEDATFDEKEPECEGRKPESKVNVSSSSSAQSKKHDDKTKREAKGKSHVESLTGYRNLSAEFEDFFDNSINEDNATGTLVPAVGNKKDERGIVVSNKARLVIQGHTQEEGIDYEEVFAPVARIEAIRLFLAYASFMGFMVYQMDVKNAFLYETIKEKVYVCQPPGFEDPDYPNKVYKVIKALYGLHQAPRAWYETLANYLLENGFQRGKIDQTLFIKRQKGDILLVQIYVDDIIFGSTNKDLCKDFEKPEILRKFRLTYEKLASTPIDTKKPLLKDPDGEDVDVHTYRSMIGSLMYLTSSRPDIMFTVCACAHFQVTPKALHLHAVKRIFRYLKGKPHLGLWYLKDSPFDLVAYSDSDYDGASLDRKSTTGGCQFLGCRLISWQCKKQTVVATSSTEAKYVAVEVDVHKCYGFRINWWIMGQTVTGKEISNPFTAGSMPKTILLTFIHAYFTAVSSKVSVVWSDEIGVARLVMLGHQFWTTVAVKKVDDVTRLQALVDKKKVIITEATIRDELCLDDTEGVECLPNDEIFAKLARMSYEKPSTKLTFCKAFFSSQWKFLIQTILQCMSAKRTSWNEFSSFMASAVICLSTGRKFNFSKYIFDSLVRDVDSSTKFYMYPRFLQLMIIKQVGDLSTHTTKYTSPALTQKVFANMRRVGKGFFRVETPLFGGMLVALEVEEGDADENVEDVNAGAAAEVQPTPPQSPQAQQPTPQQQPPSQDAGISMDLLQNLIDTCTTLTRRVEHLEQDKIAQALEITKLKSRVKKLEKRNKASRLKRLKKVRMIADMDADADVVLEEAKDVATDIVKDEEETKPAKLQEVVDVVTTTKIITEVVTAASDEDFARELEAELNKNIDWDEVIDHVQRKQKEDKAVKRYQALKRKPQTEAQARKNMMIYLRNVVGFKMDYFKGMTYDDIRPVFEKHFDSNMAFLQKTKEQMDEEDAKALKRMKESQEDKAAKK